MHKQVDISVSLELIVVSAIGAIQNLVTLYSEIKQVYSSIYTIQLITIHCYQEPH